MACPAYASESSVCARAEAGNRNVAAIKAIISRPGIIRPP
jgi:hypothetical protein